MKNPQWFYQLQSIGTPETIGPVSQPEFVEALRTGKIKKKDLVSSPEATQGKWLAASTVPLFKKIQEQQQAEAAKRKQEAVARQEEQRRQKAEKRAAANDRRRAQSTSLRERLLGAKDSPESFVSTCDGFIRGIRIIGWGSVMLSVLIQIAMIAVSAMVAEDTVESLQAVTIGGILGFLAIVVQLVVAFIVIEASVLSLRFMKIVVVLLNQLPQVRQAQRVEA